MGTEMGPGGIACRTGGNLNPKMGTDGRRIDKYQELWGLLGGGEICLVDRLSDPPALNLRMSARGVCSYSIALYSQTFNQSNEIENAQHTVKASVPASSPCILQTLKQR